MELAQDTNVLKTNAKFERKHFGVGDMSIVMELLTKLYSNPIQTLTQEYICNARDASRENSSKAPIEITVPTRFSPIIKIRDYGIGLNPDRINNVFLMYGNSTKRSNNDQTGGFGIGAKSAWAYTDSFNIITYVDGIKRTYIAHKSSGSGNLDLIEEVETTESNGTCIEIAVKQYDTDKFKKAIYRAIFFWDKKERPIIHGITEEEVKTLPSAQFTFGNVQLYSALPDFIEGYGDTHLVVIDGIPYKLPYEITNETSFNDATRKIRRNVTCFLNTGDIEISPSREEIVINEKTKDYLRSNVFTPFKDNVDVFIASKYAKATSMKKTLEMYAELKENFNIEAKFQNTDYSLRGYGSYNLHNKQWYKGAIVEVSETSDDRIKKTQLDALPISQIGKAYYVDNKESPVAVNKRFRTLLDDNTHTDKIYYVKNIFDGMINELGLVKISTVAPTEKPKNTVKATRTPISKREIVLHKPNYVETSYGRTNEWRATPETKIIGDITTQIVYVPMSHKIANTATRNAYGEILGYIKNLRFIADGRVKLIENNKNFIHVDKYIKDYKLSTIEKDQILAALIQDSYSLRSFKTYIAEIEDKKLTRVLEVLNNYKPNSGIAPQILAKDYPKSKAFITFKKLVKEVETNLEVKYPLVFGRTKTQDQIDYMNYINSKGVK